MTPGRISALADKATAAKIRATIALRAYDTARLARLASADDLLQLWREYMTERAEAALAEDQLFLAQMDAYKEGK